MSLLDGVAMACMVLHHWHSGWIPVSIYGHCKKLCVTDEQSEAISSDVVPPFECTTCLVGRDGGCLRVAVVAPAGVVNLIRLPVLMAFT